MEMSSSKELNTEFYNKDEDDMQNEEQKESSCGWLNFRPRFLQKSNAPASLLFFLCAYMFFNSAVINGIYSSSLSTIEKRFNLSSKQMGIVTSIYDVAALIFTGPVSYFGAKNKPKYLSIGMLTMGVGYLIFISPHFIESPYIPVVNEKAQTSNATSSLLCHEKINHITGANCQSKSSSNLYYAMFLLAMFVAGAGCTPMISLGIPFLDESVSTRTSPIYVGIFQSAGIAAAAIGFFLSSVFLNIFVNPGVPVTITKKDMESWIGAWWLGFAIAAIFALIVSISLSAFPTKLKREQIKDEEKEKNNNDESLTRETFGKSLKILFTNRTFIFICIALSCEHFLISAATAFLPKISVFQFRITPSQAGIYVGLLPVSGALIGNLAGSYAHKKLNLSTKQALKLAVIISCLSLLAGSFMFLHCKNASVAGIHVDYKASHGSLPNAIQKCNSNCSCSDNTYLPVCVDKVTYISPCHAGCQTTTSFKSFSYCACSNGNTNKTRTATLGACASSCGIFPYIFFGISWLNSFLIMFVATPFTMATLRCVPFKLRSFAVGIQWTSVRIFGSIPGPIFLGYLIDKSCVLWYKSCNNSPQSCRLYDNKKLAISTGMTVGVAKVLVIFFMVLAWISYRNKEDNQEKQDELQINETHL